MSCIPRRIIYGVSVLALLVNALTPRIAASANDSVTHVAQADLSRAAHPQQHLRVSGQTFSCPPLPAEFDSHGIIAELPSLEMQTANVSSDFVYFAALKPTPRILTLQCRLNI